MYVADSMRYKTMPYRRLGKSGLKLSLVSLGLWHNFGHAASYENSKELLCRSFDLGITSFDLANNYGPPPGTAEEMFGKVMKNELRAYRDEMVIATKAGHKMWEGPYGDWGSRKYLISSLDQSLKRMSLNYVDIFYHHRMDPETPLEETMNALAHIVSSGKALYVGLSNYDAKTLEKAYALLNASKTPYIIHQIKYNMFTRNIEENGVLEAAKTHGAGIVAFSPLAQGLLSGKYNSGIPQDSRAASATGFLRPEQIKQEHIEKVIVLQEIAKKQSITLAQLALKWCLRHEEVTSVIIGARTLAQLEENAAVAVLPDLDEAVLKEIDAVFK